MFWFNSYLDVNVDSYKSLNCIPVPNVFSLMLIIWVVFFTMERDGDLNSLGNVVSKIALDTVKASEQILWQEEQVMELLGEKVEITRWERMLEWGKEEDYGR